MTYFGFAVLITAFIGLISWYSQSRCRVKADLSEIPELIKSAMPIWAAMAMAMTVQWGSQLISGGYLPSEELAILFVALRFSLLTTFILIAINLYAAPRFAASAKTNNVEEIRATSLLCSRVMFGVATPIVLILFLGADFFMSLFGEDYRQGSNILRILILGQYVNVITGSVGFLLNMTGHEKDMRNVVFFSGPLAIILGMTLVPVYGLTGAAVATGIAVASQNLLAVRLVKKRLGFNTLNLFPSKT
jgi:O-antigen/teichoic acid export membrane protein